MTKITYTNKNDRSLSKKATRGIFWNFLAYGLSKGVVLLTTSILARLLAKDEFGLMAIALVAINFLAIVKDLGLGVALIQRKGDVNDAANTVFTINLLIGLALTLLLVPIAPLFSSYFKDPVITPVLRWLGLSFFINAIGAVHVVWLMRELDYRRKLIPDVGNALIKGLVSIGLAYSGYGVWSLVFGQLSGSIASVILVWVVLPWRPKFTVDRKVAGALMKFGASVTGIDILSVISDNLDYMIVGRVFGLAQLSIYTLAYRLPEMLLVGNLWVMGNVIFPAFSTIQDRLDELRQGFLASVRLIELLAMPICLGMLIAADPIIRVLFGPEWLDAIPVLRILSIYVWIYSIGYHIGGVYKAIGRPDILLKLSIFTLVILFPALIFGSRFGLVGIAFGHLIAMLIRRIVSLKLAARFLNITLLDILRELKPSFQAGLLMTPVTLIMLWLTMNSIPILQLTLVVLSGMVSYLGVVWWIERDKVFQLARAVGILR